MTSLSTFCFCKIKTGLQLEQSSGTNGCVRREFGLHFEISSAVIKRWDESSNAKQVNAEVEKHFEEKIILLPFLIISFIN